MPKETEENYKLLRESDVIESEETLQGHDYIDKAKARKSSPRTGCVVSALVVSAITNLLLASYVVLFGFKTNIQDQQISKSSDSGVSLYGKTSMTATASTAVIVKNALPVSIGSTLG